MRVAIIGTREPIPYYFSRAGEYAFNLVSKGVEVSTGGAKGIDHAAMLGAKKADVSKLWVFLPWSKFNSALIPDGANRVVYNKRFHTPWSRSVIMHHPNPKALSDVSFALHARNYGIVAHPRPVDAVIAFPQGIHDLGGTGQGMRVAEALGIKVFNMLEPLVKDDVEVFIQSIGV